MSALSILFVGLILALATNCIIFCQATSTIRCIESERKALFELKKDLIDPSNRLSSWSGDGDCCYWAGIVCDNSTGHVTQLHLQNPFIYHMKDLILPKGMRSMLGGKINRSLLKLKHLFHLDLSSNNFIGSQIPSFLGSITTLRYLNLSNCEFSGRIPPQIGNLTNLQFLDIGSWRFYGGLLHVENLRWLANLSSLEYLDLSTVDLSKETDWLQVTSNALPLLTQLHLSDCMLQHIPSVSSVNFSSLSVLDLSFNSLDNILTSQCVFSLNNLVYIDLTNNNFEGPIPNYFRNMTFLRHLDLSSNKFTSSIPNWLYSFTSLEYLDLSCNSFQGKVFDSIANLTTLNTLFLFGNHFQIDGEFIKSIEYLCKLRRIDLSNIKLNQHTARVFQILSTCISHKLEVLSLTSTQLFGQLEDLHLELFKNLISVDLSVNSISGTIPISIGQLSSLESINLGVNSISGTIPISIGQLSSLESIDISYNSLEGVVSESHFNNLTQLQYFRANGNQLSLSVDSNWIPPFQLKILHMGSWHLGQRFPQWFFSQKYLGDINISCSSISDTIPSWFWNLSSLYFVNLSHNQIQGELPNLSNLQSLRFFDLSSNHFKGHLPYVSPNIVGFNLFNNSLSGSLSHFLCHEMNETMVMEALRLGNNFLLGEIPDCWTKWKFLNVIELSNNNLTGSIPNSIGDLTILQSLHLRNNSFSGNVPSSLSGCTKLVNIDLAENQFEGEIPAWIGKNLQNLAILNFRANKFHGAIPEELCQLTSLRILDVANNNFYGPIPKCIHNFTAMISINYSENPISYRTLYEEIVEVELIMMKRAMLEYSTNLKLLRIIDMSCNNLSGNIPLQITRLKELESLNLSHNFLTGKIPQDIGAMRSLESLDLSGNRLSGDIPQSMSSMNFLSQLNLSNNELEGTIPTGTQLQSLDASSFSGNKLCGPPLTKSCNERVEIDGKEDDGGNSDEGLDVKWFYMGMAYGFGVGFWVVMGSLIFFRKWRHFYFQLLDRLWVRLRFGCL